MAKAKLDVDVNVTGDDDLRGLADALEEVDDSAEKAGMALADLNEIGSRLSSLGGNLSSIGTTLTAAITLPIVGVGVAALKLGADAVETENLVQQSFQGMTQAAIDWSQSLSDSLGLNKFELREQAASFNLLAVNMGQTREAAFSTSTRMVELAADLDSLLNLSSKGIDPIRALQSGLVGNSEALRSLNVFVNDATLRQTAFEKGITETNRELTQQEKFLATLEAIYQQTTAATGDLARTMDSPINKMRIFGTRIVETGTSFGVALLPIMTQLIPVLDAMVSGVEKAVDFFSKLPQPVQTAVVAVAALAAAVGPLLLVFGKLISIGGTIASTMGTIGISTTSVVSSMSKFSGSLSATIPTFTELIGSLKQIPSLLKGVGSGATGLFSNLNSLVASATSVQGGFLGVSAATSALSVAAASAGAVIGVQLGGALLATGDKIRGVNDPIREAVQQVGFLEGAASLAGGALEGFSNIASHVQSAIEQLGIVGDLLSVPFEGLRLIWDGLAVVGSKLGDVFFKLGSLAQNVTESYNIQKNATDEQKAALAAFISSQNEAIKTAGVHAKATTESTVQIQSSKKELQAAAKEAEAYEKRISTLASTLGGAGLTKQADDATAAIQRLGGVSQISATGLQSLDSLIQKLRTDSAQLSPELFKVAQELNKIALFEGAQKLAKTLEAPVHTAEQLTEMLEGVSTELGNVGDVGTVAFSDIEATVGGVVPKVFDFGDAMDGVNDVLSEARGVMNLFGVESDSTFGKVVAGASKVFDTFNSILGLADKLIGAFGGSGGLSGVLGGLFSGGGGGGGIGGIASSVLGGGGGIGGLLGGGGAAGAAGSAAGAAGGAAGGIGGAVSAGASSVIGGISTALAAIPVAGWIGLAGIGVGLLAKKIFGQPSEFERVGMELGVSVAEGVQHGIVNLFEERGGTIGEAIQLSLGEVIKDQVAQGVANFDELTEKAADTFSFIERGEITAAEGATALGESVAQLTPQLESMGAVGRDQMERLLRATQSTGIEFAGVDQAIQAMANRLVSDAQAGGEAFLTTMNTLGVTGRDSLEFIKNFAASSGIELANVSAITAILGNELGGVATQANNADQSIQIMANRLANDAQSGGEAFLGTMNSLGMTGKDSLQLIKSLAVSSGVELANVNAITDILAGALGGVAVQGENAKGAIDGIVGAADRARSAIQSIPNLPSGGGDGGNRGPTRGAQSGFEGRVMGPQTFSIEPGVLEDVSISRVGSGGGKKSVEVHMGNISVNVGTGSGGASGLRQMMDELERNQQDQLERLKKIIQ